MNNIYYILFIIISIILCICIIYNTKNESYDYTCGVSPSSQKWDKCYFKSGSIDANYTVSDIGTKATDAGIELDGADTSCGSADPCFWGQMNLVPTNQCNSSKKPNEMDTFNVPYKYTDAYKTLTKQTKSNMCSNCGTDGNSDCNGHIQLVNPDNNGKVACFAHGAFGQNIMFSANCTTDHLDEGVSQDKFNDFQHKLGMIIRYSINSTQYCDPSVKYDDSNDHIKYYQMNNDDKSKGGSCLILKTAFDNAFKDNPEQNFWPDFYKPKNSGIAISWGHGATDGGCGSFHLMMADEGPNRGNTILVFQIGTRAWSGEWTDNVCTGQQSYLTDGLKGSDDSRTGLQPVIVRVSLDQIDTLLNYLYFDWKLPNSNYTLSDIRCKQYCRSCGSEQNDTQCKTIVNEDTCKATTGWDCTWLSSGYKPTRCDPDKVDNQIPVLTTSDDSKCTPAIIDKLKKSINSIADGKCSTDNKSYTTKCQTYTNKDTCNAAAFPYECNWDGAGDGDGTTDASKCKEYTACYSVTSDSCCKHYIAPPQPASQLLCCNNEECKKPNVINYTATCKGIS